MLFRSALLHNNLVIRLLPLPVVHYVLMVKLINNPNFTLIKLVVSLMPLDVVAPQNTINVLSVGPLGMCHLLLSALKALGATSPANQKQMYVHSGWHNHLAISLIA